MNFVWLFVEFHSPSNKSLKQSWNALLAIITALELEKINLFLETLVKEIIFETSEIISYHAL